jgi:hypothetical protein
VVDTPRAPEAPPADPAAALPTSARLVRGALLLGLAAGPAAWLLLPPLLRPGVLPGLPSTGVFPLLHRWWALTTTAPPRFPEPADPAPTDALALVVSPLTALLGAPGALTVVLLAGFVATLVVTWRFTRRLADPWTAAAATAAFTASPAVIAGVASGEVDAWHGWAAIGLALATGPAALVVGALAALVAPTLLPAALLPAAFVLWTREGPTRWWPLGGWAAAVGLRTLLGWPSGARTGGIEAWFARVELSPAPDRVGEVYVGVAAVALLALGLARPEARRYVWLGLAALFAASWNAPLPPERFLVLVPLAGALAGLTAVRGFAPAWGPAAAVWVATAVVGEGWKGVAVDVPLATISLAAPADRAAVGEGPVLDLPASRPALRRGAWAQAWHGQPVASDGEGHLAPAAAALAATLSTGGCADPATVGFRTVIARREGSLRELGPLRACLGEPAWDDGAVVVWRIADGGVPGAAAASAPGEGAPPAVPGPTPEPGSPDRGPSGPR